MKLLLLAFAVISFLAQTTQGGWGAKKCYNNVGRCRTPCKSNEKEYSTCPNKKKCCVPADKLPKEGTGTTMTPGGTGPASPPMAGALTTLESGGAPPAAAPPDAGPPAAAGEPAADPAAAPPAAADPAPDAAPADPAPDAAPADPAPDAAPADPAPEATTAAAEGGEE